MRKNVFLILSILILIPLNISAATLSDLALQEDTFIKVAEQVGPAVVSVSVVQVYTYGGKRYYYPFRSFDPHLDEFLREFFEAPREYRQSGLGSGVIIDKEGYILTNEHVVSGADEIEVTLPDGRKFKGVLKGADPRSDLAVIKIDAPDLPVAKLGDSDKIKTGQWVMAIGNPFGFIMNNPQPTITVGLISALHRSFSYKGMDQHRYYGNLIQTDAAINRGNSGGPLVNLKGEIIGINALIYSTTGGYQGIGFAIPINRAKKILDELIAGKEIIYGWMGVQVQSLTPELVASFSFPDTKGALIAEIISDSPADKSGLKKGDLIRKIDDKEVLNSNDLVNIITSLNLGEKVEVLVWRDGKEVPYTITIGQRPEEGKVILEEITASDTKGWRGLEVIESDNGLKVFSVTPGSPGFIAGIRENDIIDEIDRKEIKGLTDFNAIIEKLKGEVLVHTNRGYFVVKEGT